MPTLADIYSAINTAKRKASDFVQNPGTSLQQMVGNANDRARVYNQQLSLAAQGTGAPARGMQPTPEQLAADKYVTQTMAEAYNPVGMTVFHGSPHLFQKFDIAKIGTGEGNQAYGRGLYMAESPDLAQTYANKLTKVNGQAISDQLDSRMQYLNMLKQQAKDGDLNAVKNIPLIEKSISDLQSQGSVYKVDLPDTHIRRMLDWDNPLKDQPKVVRNLAKSLGMDLNDLGGDLLAKVGKGDEGRKILQNAGIRGVKYLDAQSRDATKGTRNFVVFDPNHLNILERNSKPIK
jgi:hypothetical protein